MTSPTAAVDADDTTAGDAAVIAVTATGAPGVWIPLSWRNVNPFVVIIDSRANVAAPFVFRLR
jgi:hypothetical protein